MEPILSLRQVRKRYGAKTVLDGLDLAVPRGALFALLGENGAGKSTTLRILTGVIPHDSGEVRVLGADPWRDASSLRTRVAYVPEKPKYYDWMSVRELGRFASGFHANGYREKYDEWAAEFDLDPKQKLKTLSKGQYAKVGLALALALDPEVLILDEPTSGLDLFVRREFLSSMVGLAAEGRTLILSSHQIAEVERVASHVAFLAEGKALFAGSMEELRDRVVSVTVETERAPADWSEWGTLLRLERDAALCRAVLRDPKAEALVGVESDLLSLEGMYEALLARRGGQP